jgi:Ni,Fe-hydrogenase III large subunit
MKYITVINNQAIPVSGIPEISYDEFHGLNTGFVSGYSENHCVNYFGYNNGDKIKLICCIANDLNHEIYISSSLVNSADHLQSFTAIHPCFEKFEREIHENFGVSYTDHPWLKPVRFAQDRFDKEEIIADYPFYAIDSEELHEVGVGPIHAGIIEPGHFRFICNGEQILHLEIQLGYQHRGIEKLFIEKKQLNQLATLAESIAGDTTVGHAVAFAQIMESLCGFEVSRDIKLVRTVALELERIAVHTGDLSAVCTDIAYQLGSAVFGRLRTPVINFMQEWCGNRFSKGLIRPGQNRYPFTLEFAKRLTEILDAFEPDFTEMNRELFSLPSALSRLERTGVVSFDDALSIGTVGMAARSSGLTRDIRSSHPDFLYNELGHQPVVKHHGDVYSRVQVRKEEVFQSIKYLRMLINHTSEVSDNRVLNNARADLFTLSLVEGWRGEICHCAITDSRGDIKHFKVKDPSFHNWLALALAVRNNEISDFPVCNKSFNLSYCGHDL